MAASQFKAYGVFWQKTVDPANLHLSCIKAGGEWKNKSTGEQCGGGLVHHYKEFARIVWPWVVQHRWFDLILENYVSHRTIVLIGPASSGKTFVSALLVLVDYFAHPDCTTVICCSTTKERLQDRVWADVTKLFKAARKERPWLPGNIIEGRLRIVTDSRKDSPDGRDFRNGCFPTGTLVDTPTGKAPIESLKIGDLVFNASGVGRIKGTHTRTADVLMRVTLNDGRRIECTSEHPFLTQQGWKKAIDLETFDMVFSADETLQILRDNDSEQHNVLLNPMRKQETMPGVWQAGWGGVSREEFLLHEMSGLYASEEVRPMRKEFQSRKKERSLEKRETGNNGRKVLQSNMLRPLGISAFGNRPHKNSEMQILRSSDDWRSLLAGVLLGEMQASPQDDDLPEMWKRIPVLQGQTKNEPRKVLQPSVPSHNSRTNRSLQTFPKIHDGAPSWKPVYRRSISKYNASSGVGWKGSPKSETSGRTANQRTRSSWVESVKVLEQGSGAGFDESKKCYRVHNLSVTGHPSYSVNGVIVHNCVGVPCKRGEAFVGIADFAGIKNKRVRLLGDELSLLPKAFCDAISNLDKNPDFKCIGLGNPKDTTDALGVLGEPAAHLGGWDGGIDQQFGTKTWAIRRDEGIAIQLPGDDSPNLDGKLGIDLIDQAAINRDVSFYGKDSLHYTMFNLGRMPKGQGSRRVLTRQLCLKYNAMDDPLWRDDNLKWIAFLDAAYRGVGGDRCVLGFLCFGHEIGTQKFSLPDSALAHSMANNIGRNQVIALKEMMVVPIDPSLDEPAEYQIANYVRQQCENRNIPPEDFFYDAGMKTSLVSAFAKTWDSPGETIDCGGMPTESPVSEGIPTTCREFYSKFISELWFSVRMTVEAGQVRGFTDDVIMEFAAREWMKVGNNKTEVEPKERVKEKTGRSPDLADAVAIGFYGARQRGFRIARLKTDQPSRRNRNGVDWRESLRKQSRDLWATGQLETAAS